MSNKKRIKQRVLKLQQKEVSKFIFSIKNIDKASDHANDSLRMLLIYTNKLGTTVKEFLAECTFPGWEPEKRKILYSMDFKSDISFELPNDIETENFIQNTKVLSNIWCAQHEILAKQIPVLRREDVLGLMKVGFTLFEAFETLQETYKL